ncbi:hypothetical protein Tco_0723716 [Tanacetum coccineum]
MTRKSYGMVAMQGVWCWRVFVYKEVTRRHLEALELKGGDGGACKLLGRLLGDVIEVLEVLVPGQMTHLVASLTLDSANSYVMQRASCTQRKVSMVPFVFSIAFVLNWVGSISSDSFLPSILLLVVIIVTVVIVVVILIVIVVVIVGVVIVVAIIMVVVVVGGVSSILKLLFVVIGFLRKIVFYYMLHQPLGYGNGFFQGLRFLSSNISFNTSGYMQLVLPELQLYFSKSVADGQSLSSSGTGSLPSGRVDLTDDEDPTNEDGDTRMGDSTGGHHRMCMKPLQPMGNATRGLRMIHMDYKCNVYVRQPNPSSFTCRKSSTERNVRPQSVADQAASSNEGHFVGQSEGTSCVHNEDKNHDEKNTSDLEITTGRRISRIRALAVITPGRAL